MYFIYIVSDSDKIFANKFQNYNDAVKERDRLSYFYNKASSFCDCGISIVIEEIKAIATPQKSNTKSESKLSHLKVHEFMSPLNNYIKSIEIIFNETYKYVIVENRYRTYFFGKNYRKGKFINNFDFYMRIYMLSYTNMRYNILNSSISSIKFNMDDGEILIRNPSDIKYKIEDEQVLFEMQNFDQYYHPIPYY